MAKVIPGNLRVSNDVIADLAGYAALECYGVVGMAVTDQQEGVTRLLPMQRLRRGIDVSVEDGHIVVDLHVVVEQGVNMAAISSNLVSSVKFILGRIAASIARHLTIQSPERASKEPRTSQDDHHRHSNLLPCSGQGRGREGRRNQQAQRLPRA